MRYIDIDEAGAGPSRIVTHVRNGTPFFTISATRGERPHVKNLQLTNDLRRRLSGMSGLSFVPIEGSYEETRPDGSKERQVEYSFFVMPKRGLDTMALDRFREIGLTLAKLYDQEAIGYGDGNLISLQYTNGQVYMLGDATTFSEGAIQDILTGGGGSSEIRNRRFSFTDLKSHPKAVPYGKAGGPPVTPTRRLP